MNTTSFKKPEQVINIREIIWDLLQQWKAVLIVALLMALLISGLKYVKDTRSYDASKEAAAAERQAGVSAEQKIEEVLAALSEDERMTVEYLSKQEDWMNAEKEYISNSILMNTNPANQRTLTLDYLITTAGGSESNVFSILNGYSSFASNEDFVGPIGDVVAPDVDDKYIAELIRVDNGSNFLVNEGKTLLVSADKETAIISYYIVLPEDADAVSVESAATTSLKKYSSELSGKIGQHSISLLKSSESYQYNADLINNRNNILYSVYNLNNNAKNMKASLTDTQKAAVESISAIKKVTANTDSADDNAESEEQELQKPGFSKKYALLGFVLGALAYAFVYLLLVIIRGRINSASDVEYYTQNRLLGEVYEEHKQVGFTKLFHSDFVEKIRYRGKTDPKTQIAKAIDTLDAICKHAQIKKITMFDLAGKTGASVSAIIDAIKGKGIDVEIVNTSGGVEDKRLLDVENAVLVTGPETKVAALSELISLCADYDVKSFGSIYAA